MPNRILKETICTSESVDGLSLAAEVFFYRLIVNCDDYGRADARPRVLRSRCFPLRVDIVSDADIIAWLKELDRVTIVGCYQVGGAPYVFLPSWDKHQQIRAKRSKFPAPDDEGAQAIEPACIGNHLQAVAITCPRNPIQSNPNPIQSESESNIEKHEAAQAPPTSPATAGQRFYLETHKRKRFANNIQAQAVADLEKEVGTAILEKAITWAAKKGSSDLEAITTTAHKMKANPDGKENSRADRGGHSQGSTELPEYQGMDINDFIARGASTQQS